MDIDQDRLREALTGARGIEIDRTGIVDAINQVIATMPAIFEVDGAGLMVIDGDLSLSAIAWSDEPGRILETVQEEVGVGPCVETLLEDRVTTVSDLRTDQRWPDVSAAVTPHGVTAVLGVPVHVDGENVGALNVYSQEPVEWNRQSIDAIDAFSGVLGQLLGLSVMAGKNEGLVQQLQQALESRVTIERAVGVLMGRHGLGSVDAFNRLRAEARRQRRRVVEISTEVLEGLQL